MNRSSFFDALRGGAMFPRGYAQVQVDGLNAILDEAGRRGTPTRHLAYILATIAHETSQKMQPVEENLNYSAKRLTEVWPKRFPTISSAKPYAHNSKALAEKAYRDWPISATPSQETAGCSAAVGSLRSRVGRTTPNSALRPPQTTRCRCPLRCASPSTA